jgi:hypothetical protein
LSATDLALETPVENPPRAWSPILAEHPEQALGGVVVHGGDKGYWLDDRILAVPWWPVM